MYKAKQIHDSHGPGAEVEQHRVKIRSFESQIETLTERLAELPKTVSATPIYEKMEKLERLKAIETEALRGSGTALEKPAPMQSYGELLAALNLAAKTPSAQDQGHRNLDPQGRGDASGLPVAFLCRRNTK